MSNEENEPTKTPEQPSSEGQRAKPVRPDPSRRSGSGFSPVLGLGALGIAIGVWVLFGPGPATGIETEATASEQTPEPSGTAAAAAEPAGPCEEWRDKLCEEVGGKQAAACSQARSAAELLSEASCKAQLADLPATVARVKVARADCDELMGKLCTDLGKETSSCKLVEAKTPSMPPTACKDMLGKYDKVLGELKARELAVPGQGRPGMPPPGMSPGGMRAGGASPGLPPGAVRVGPAGAVPPGGAPPSKTTGAVVPVVAKPGGPAVKLQPAAPPKAAVPPAAP
jgi:hypothetical protein